MGEFGVIVKGGCHFFFSDQGPLLKGSGGQKRSSAMRRYLCCWPGESEACFLLGHRYVCTRFLRRVSILGFI